MNPPQWCHATDFPSAHEVCIGFKTIEHVDESEHWMNRLAIQMTKKPGDIFPCGSICHAEVMMQLEPGKWWVFSISKAYRTQNSDWKPGRVFCKPVLDTRRAPRNDYVFFTVPIHRGRQKAMYDFLLSQIGGSFNRIGFYGNFILPWLGWGTKMYNSNVCRRPRRWFCTELIVVALQAANVQPFMKLWACNVSPNGLYRTCSQMESVLSSPTPTAETIVIL